MKFEALQKAISETENLNTMVASATMVELQRTDERGWKSQGEIDYWVDRLNSLEYDRPLPDGFTNIHDSKIWNVGHVFMWSSVYDAYMQWGQISMKPNETIGDAFERAYPDEFMSTDFDVYFSCDH